MQHGDPIPIDCICLKCVMLGARSLEVTCCHVGSCFPRMDDIQLCKDIMDLKQELQNLVAIPGKHVRLYLVLAAAGWWVGWGTQVHCLYSWGLEDS